VIFRRLDDVSAASRLPSAASRLTSASRASKPLLTLRRATLEIDIAAQHSLAPPLARPLRGAVDASPRRSTLRSPPRTVYPYDIENLENLDADAKKRTIDRIHVSTRRRARRGAPLDARSTCEAPQNFDPIAPTSRARARRAISPRAARDSRRIATIRTASARRRRRDARATTTRERWRDRNHRRSTRDGSEG